MEFSKQMSGMEDKIILKFLKEIPLFRAVLTSKLENLIQHIKLMQLSTNQVLIQKGKPIDDIYFLKKGIMEISKEISRKHQKIIEIREPGRIFGEMELFNKQPAIATIKTKSNCILYAIPVLIFLQFLEEHPRLITQITADITTRWRKTEISIKQQMIKIEEESTNLLKQYNKIQSILSSMDDLMFIINNQGIFIEYYQPSGNPELFVSPDLFLKKHYSVILPSHVVVLLENAITSLMSNKVDKSIVQFDYQLNLNNKTFWFNAHVSQLKNDLSQIIGIIIVARNITDRRLLELQQEHSLKQIEETNQKLLNSQQLLQDIMDNMPAIIYVKDITGKHQFINTSFELVTGINRQQVIGKTNHELFPEQVAEEFEKNDKNAIMLHKAIEFEEQFPIKNQLLSFLSIKFPLFDQNKEIYAMCGISIDITKRKQIEIELKQSNEELEQFAQILTHDLKEPIRTIHGFIGVLQKGEVQQLSSKGQELFSYVQEGSNRLSRMIDSLQEYFTLNKKMLNFQPTNCSDLWQNTQDNLQILINETGTIISNDKLPITQICHKVILHVFQNLLINAIKYNKSSPPRIHMSVKQETKTNEWLFSLQDNGIGIDTKDLTRIFQPFQRLHLEEDYPGLGMGLAFSKKIVALHGGNIWAESDLGKGSTFYFSLPFKITSLSI